MRIYIYINMCVCVGERERERERERDLVREREERKKKTIVVFFQHFCRFIHFHIFSISQQKKGLTKCLRRGKKHFCIWCERLWSAESLVKKQVLNILIVVLKQTLSSLSLLSPLTLDRVTAAPNIVIVVIPCFPRTLGMDQTIITVCPRRLLIITIPGEIVVVPSGPAVAGGMDITIIILDIERTVDITSTW